MDETHHSQTEYQLPSIVEHAQSPVEGARQAIASQPIASLIAAGTVGFLLGAVIFSARRSRGRSSIEGKAASLERAVELANSGTVRAIHALRNKLHHEGYSVAQIEGEAKRQLRRLISVARASMSS